MGPNKKDSLTFPIYLGDLESVGMRYFFFIRTHRFRNLDQILDNLIK